MIEIKFPFNKKFDNYYLFHDNEIVNNPTFNKQVKALSKKVDGNELIVDLIHPGTHELFSERGQFKILNSESGSLEILDLTKFNDNKTYGDFLFEFLIYDCTGDWGIYCNVGHDYGIGACNESINQIFFLRN